MYLYLIYDYVKIVVKLELFKNKKLRNHNKIKLGL